jgi:hypothetical protein
MDNFYTPIERPGEKKDFGSTAMKFKDSKGKYQKLGEKENEESKSFFTRLRSKEESKDRFSQSLTDIKSNASKNPATFDKLSKLLEKDE